MSFYASNNSSDDLNLSLKNLTINTNLSKTNTNNNTNSNINSNNSISNSNTNTKTNNTITTNATANSSSNPNSSSNLAPYTILKIKNIPNDITLREAFLIFSLCLNDVNFVDIVQEQNNQGSGTCPSIISRFYSSKIASQVFQLLNDKQLFGTAFPRVQCELINGPNNNTGGNITVTSQNKNYNSSNYLFMNPFNDDLHAYSNSIVTSNLNSKIEHSPGISSPKPNKLEDLKLNLTPDINDTLSSINNHHLSMMSSSNNHITGWPKEESTPLATPSNTSQIIRNDPLLLNNPISMNLTTPILSDWPSNPPNSASNASFFSINDLTQTVVGNSYSSAATTTTTSNNNNNINNNNNNINNNNNNNNNNNSNNSNNNNNNNNHNHNSCNSKPSSNENISTASHSNQPPLMRSQSHQSSTSPKHSTVIPDLSLLARVPPPANPADQNPPCNTLYVGNLPPDTTENELRMLFRLQPGFKRLSFRTKQNNGASSHHGPMCFVEFEDVAYATKALAELYGKTLPRQNALNNNKGGIRLSFSKNPLGVRGPGQQRRNNGPSQQSQPAAQQSQGQQQQGQAQGQEQGQGQFQSQSQPQPLSQLTSQSHSQSKRHHLQQPQHLQQPPPQQTSTPSDHSFQRMTDLPISGSHNVPSVNLQSIAFNNPAMNSVGLNNLNGYSFMNNQYPF